MIAKTSHADEMLFSFGGEVLASDTLSALVVADPCSPPCEEFLDNGHFGVSFAPFFSGELANYHRWITQSPQTPPPSLWVEWRFRSNHPKPEWSYSCDASVYVRFADISEVVYLYGDAAISPAQNDFVPHPTLEEFFTLRFESTDGAHYRFSVDGNVFTDDFGHSPSTGFNLVQFRSLGGCGNDWVSNKYNEWDFVRYGTIDLGERIVSADPPMGFLNQSDHANLDRFTVTYDSPNHAYIDDITVNVTCATAPNCPEVPQVIATKRLDNGPPEVLEIVLDRPLPPNARTVFTFTDVDPADPEIQFTQTVAYTFQLGDVDADGDWDLRDFASAQNCFLCGECLSDQELRWMHCRAFDFVTEIDLVRIKLDDLATFIGILTGPGI